MNLNSLLQFVKNELKKISPTPDLDTELIIAHVTGLSKEEIFANGERIVSERKVKKIKQLLEKRATDYPIAYITNTKSFYKYDFFVDERVLIPRPLTEVIVEETLKQLKIINSKLKIDLKSKIKNLKFLMIDIGSGSGNIILSIMKEWPKELKKRTTFIANDIDQSTFDVLKKNKTRLNIKEKIKFVPQNLLKQNNFIKFLSKHTFDTLIITTNLPYVSENEYKKRFDNLKFEPKNAITTGDKANELYVPFIKQLALIKNKRIFAIFELDPRNQKKILKISSPLKAEILQNRFLILRSR